MARERERDRKGGQIEGMTCCRKDSALIHGAPAIPGELLLVLKNEYF